MMDVKDIKKEGYRLETCTLSLTLYPCDKNRN